MEKFYMFQLETDEQTFSQAIQCKDSEAFVLYLEWCDKMADSWLESSYWEISEEEALEHGFNLRGN